MDACTASGIISGYQISLLLGLIAMLAAAAVWKVTLPPGTLSKTGFAIGLLVGAFFNTGLDSIRYVLLMMFARSFNDQAFITAALLGPEALGWPISAMEFLQFVGNEHSDGNVSRNFNFGPTTALIICTIMYILTCIAFLCITTVNSMKKRSSLFACDEKTKTVSDVNGNSVEHCSQTKNESTSLLNAKNVETVDKSSASEFYPLFLCLTWGVCFAGVFHFCPPFQSYSALPYGQTCYNLTSAVTFSSGPLSIIFAHFTPRIRKLKYIAALLLIFLFDCCCILYLALQCPNPPFRDSSSAFYGVIFLWFLLGFLGMYLSTTASYNLADRSESCVEAGAMASQISGLLVVFIPLALTSFNVLKDPLQ